VAFGGVAAAIAPQPMNVVVTTAARREFIRIISSPHRNDAIVVNVEFRSHASNRDDSALR
jgi:hypothetical protein